MRHTIKRHASSCSNVEELKRRVNLLETTLKHHGIPVPGTSFIKHPANLIPSRKSLYSIKHFRTLRKNQTRSSNQGTKPSAIRKPSVMLAQPPTNNV